MVNTLIKTRKWEIKIILDEHEVNRSIEAKNEKHSCAEKIPIYYTKMQYNQKQMVRNHATIL
jgi:hypothetical protein